MTKLQHTAITDRFPGDLGGIAVTDRRALQISRPEV